MFAMSMFGLFLSSTLCPNTSRQPLRFYYIPSISVSSLHYYGATASLLRSYWPCPPGLDHHRSANPYILTIRYYITSQRIVSRRFGRPRNPDQPDLQREAAGCCSALSGGYSDGSEALLLYGYCSSTSGTVRNDEDMLRCVNLLFHSGGESTHMEVF